MTIIVIQTMNTVSKVTAARTVAARTRPGTMTRPGARSECTCSHLWREQMPTQTLTQVELPVFYCIHSCLSFFTHCLSFYSLIVPVFSHPLIKLIMYFSPPCQNFFIPSFACHFTFPCLSFSTHFLFFLDPFAFLFMAPFHVFFRTLACIFCTLFHYTPFMSVVFALFCLSPPPCLFFLPPLPVFFAPSFILIQPIFACRFCTYLPFF
jgi:hypothetical protein